MIKIDLIVIGNLGIYIYFIYKGSGKTSLI